MKIFLPGGTQWFDIVPHDSSYTLKQIMGDLRLVLYYSLPEHKDIPIGAYCNYDNKQYYCLRPIAVTQVHNRNFNYTAIFEEPIMMAKKWIFINPIDKRVKFSLTAKPAEHLQMVVDNMKRNSNAAGINKIWEVGNVIKSEELTITYDCNTCFEALELIASEFKTEYYINTTPTHLLVNLRKMEYNKQPQSQIALSYGKGGGLKPNIGRTNQDDSFPLEVLFVQGGTKNIDPSHYDNQKELLLPKNKTIRYDGEYFEGEEGFNSAEAKLYMTDTTGKKITKGIISGTLNNEGCFDGTNIYPKRIGTVTSIVVVDTEKHLYDIVDNTIPQTLNYSDCLIAGESMTIIFQRGRLAGKEFNVKYIHDPVGGNPARRFEIVPIEVDGEIMPSESFKPEVNDTYVVFGCMLPQQYICDNVSKTGASWDMFRDAVRFFNENDMFKFVFTGVIDPIWAQQNYGIWYDKIKLGSYIKLQTPMAGTASTNEVVVRITSVKEYINKPRSPEVTFSTALVSTKFLTTLKKYKNTETAVLTQLQYLAANLNVKRGKLRSDVIDAICHGICEEPNR